MAIPGGLQGASTRHLTHLRNLPCWGDEDSSDSRGTVRRPAELPVPAAVRRDARRRGRATADGVRRGRSEWPAAGVAVARRAELVVPVSQGRPGACRRCTACGGLRPGRVWAVRQARQARRPQLRPLETPRTPDLGLRTRSTDGRKLRALASAVRHCAGARVSELDQACAVHRGVCQSGLGRLGLRAGSGRNRPRGPLRPWAATRRDPRARARTIHPRTPRPRCCTTYRQTVSRTTVKGRRRTSWPSQPVCSTPAPR